MLSGRSWFERFPRQLRFFVAMLALLSFVAPTWHICELGGHAHATCDAAHHEPRLLRSASGAPICFCAPHPEGSSQSAPTARFHFAAHSPMAHDAQCLALLLRAMPGVLVSPTHLARLATLVAVPCAARRDFAARRFARAFSNRGPPVALAFAL